MCNLYHLSRKDELAIYLRRHGRDWIGPDLDPRPVGPFGQGLFFRRERGVGVVGQAGQWGLIRPGQPERIDYIRPRVLPGQKSRAARPRSTNNARIEGIDTKPTFRAAWSLGRRCLVPAAWYQEPNWETDRNIWWQLRRADGEPWMIAGLWSEWVDPSTGELVPNFTMLTVNCDGHPLLCRLHKPDPQLPADAQDKRSLVHINPSDWDLWLSGGVEEAGRLLTPQPAEVFDQSDRVRTDEALASMGRGAPHPMGL